MESGSLLKAKVTGIVDKLNVGYKTTIEFKEDSKMFRLSSCENGNQF
jgi:hypothetical protein